MSTTANHVCVYNNCLLNNKLCKDISFFKFPIANQERTEKWKQNCGNVDIGRMNANALRNKLICEKHFYPEHIMINNRRKLLTRNAVPKMFKTKESSDASDNETSNETLLHNSRVVQNVDSSRTSSKLDETNNDKLKVNVTNLKTYKAKPKSAATTKSTESNEIPIQQTAEVQKHEDDSLYHFFMSGYHATRVLPKHVQCKIKNKISGIIFEEEKKVFEDKTVETNATTSLSCDNFIPFVQKIEKDDAIEIN